MIRKRKKRTPGSILILISAIVMLNMAGISYAYWNDGLSIGTSISTGDIAVQFINNTSLEKLDANGLSVRFEDNNCTMIVEGTVEETVLGTIEETGETIVLGAEYSDYEGSFNFDIANLGRIPAELVKVDLNKSEQLSLQLDQQLGILQPYDSFSGKSGKLNVPVKAAEGSYDFTIEFLFRQYVN